MKHYATEELETLVEYSFFDLLQHVKRHYAADTLLKFYDETQGIWVTKNGEQLQADVLQCVAYFNHTIGTQKHIALAAGNSYAWVCLFFAGVISGNVVVPLNPMLSAYKFQQVAQQADLDMVIYQSGVFHQEAAQQAGLQADDLDALYAKCMQYQGEVTFVDKDTDRMALLFGTSGVTSDPKYVMLSQKNVLVTSLNGIHLLPLRKNHVTLSVLPLFHTYEISCGLIYHLLSGSTIVQNNGLENFRNNLSLHQPDIITAVPSMIASLQMLYEVEMAAKGTSCVSSLRHIFSGGAHLNDALIDQFQQRGVHVLQGYGLTELAAGAAMSKASDTAQHHCGNPFFYSQIKIVEGEIWVKSPALTAGYYKNESATRAAFVDGWFKTGDLGYLDEGNNLHVIGRIKNIITLETGEKVYPEEIEEMLTDKPGVEYCKVYYQDTQICADVYASKLSAAQIDMAVQEVNEGLLPFQQVTKTIPLSQLPEVTSLGKPYRR